MVEANDYYKSTKLGGDCTGRLESINANQLESWMANNAYDTGLEFDFSSYESYDTHA